MKSIPIKAILLSDLEDSEYIQQSKKEDEEKYLRLFIRFTKRLGESGTDEDD